MQTILKARGWEFARGLPDRAVDDWQTRIGFVFPPEGREMLRIGYPVAAKKKNMRSEGPFHHGRCRVHGRGNPGLERYEQVRHELKRLHNILAELAGLHLALGAVEADSAFTIVHDYKGIGD